MSLHLWTQSHAYESAVTVTGSNFELTLLRLKALTDDTRGERATALDDYQRGRNKLSPDKLLT